MLALALLLSLHLFFSESLSLYVSLVFSALLFYSFVICAIQTCQSQFSNYRIPSSLLLLRLLLLLLCSCCLLSDSTFNPRHLILDTFGPLN